MSPGAGNRQDNRQRGNAAQLLEKYKGLARDMQMQGDRVQTEFYLQFADHYYRILNENRARFEEQRRQRGEGGYDASYEDEESEEMEAAAEPRERQAADEMEAREAESRREDPRRQGNGDYRGRRPRGRPDEGDMYAERGDRGDRDDRGDRGNRSERRDEEPEEREDERIAADILPPSIGAPVGGEADEGDEPPRAPRRRGRRPRGDADEVAPAA